jgi:hypothetical protein
MDIMRLVLIAGLGLGSMVAAHSEPGHGQRFAFGVRPPNKYASLTIRKLCCHLWRSKLDSASFEQNLNEGPLKRAPARKIDKAASVAASDHA